jgi:hypothetical protein
MICFKNMMHGPAFFSVMLTITRRVLYVEQEQDVAFIDNSRDYRSKMQASGRFTLILAY